MSALANNFKTKFAGLLRGMLRRVDGNESVGLQPLHPPPLPGAVAPAPIQQTAQAQFSPAVAPTAPTPTQTANMSEIEMPLLPILERLPADLRAKWLLGGMDLSQATISISAEKVLPQLALGAVKITFGELRNAAPSLFRNGEEYDSLPIVLPLNEVLSRLHPALIARAPKRTVAVPTDIASPFGLNGQGASLSAPPPKTPTTHFYKKAPPTPSEPIKMPSPPAVAAQPLPFVPRNNVPATPAPLPRVNRSSQVFQAPPPARPSIPSIPAPAAAAPVPPAPVSPISPISSIPAAPVQFTPPTPSAPKPAAIPARPVVPPRPATPSRPVAPAATPAAAPEAPGILAPLAALSENWPESLRLEIIQSNLGNSRVALPVHLIEPALKRGRVIFPWQHVRSWLRPTSAGPSIHDATELELPLQVLAPLFLPTKKTEVKPQVKAQLPPSSVPNLFFGFPQPQPEELAAPVVTPLAPVNPIAAPIAPINPPQEEYVDKTLDQKLAETNYYVFGEGGAPQVDETDYKRPMAPATDFSTRRAMPKEIIDRTVKLPGVAGAIIALPDGLKVSYSLPPELNADTVAAFLPQLFSRVSQCSKELRMGELNNLNFTIGNIPWKIFRVNAVYFAAFGRAGQPLPTAQLAIMASELDKKEIVMAIINQATKELQVKIVYYGPAMGGKTTNLVQVHDHVQTSAGNKGKLVSLATSSDRTLFFDFLPIEAMTIRGFKTKFQLYTVPGQVIYNTTRQLVLRGVDGVVFVADSQYEKMPENIESFQNLSDNLASLKLNLDEIPYVLQYNKRDLPNTAPIEYMEYLLNNRDVQVPSFSATAHKCEGVFETLNMITRLLLHKFINQSAQQPQYA